MIQNMHLQGFSEGGEGIIVRVLDELLDTGVARQTTPPVARGTDQRYNGNNVN